MTVCLVALQLFATKRVCGESGSFESITDVWQIGDPSQVNRNGIKWYEEAGEQQEWYGHYWCQEDTILYIHCCTDHQTNTLGHEWNQQTCHQKHKVSVPFHRLRCEIIYDWHVNHTKYGLKMGKRNQNIRNVICISKIIGASDQRATSKRNRVGVLTNLEWYVRHCNGQIVWFQWIPAIKVFL